MVTQSQTIDQEIRQYRTIFVSLIVLTAVSVGIHYMGLPLGINIILVLIVAAMQAALSVCYLMHLISEKKLIYTVLIFTVFFVLSMIFLIYGGFFDHPQGSVHVS